MSDKSVPNPGGEPWSDLKGWLFWLDGMALTGRHDFYAEIAAELRRLSTPAIGGEPKCATCGDSGIVSHGLGYCEDCPAGAMPSRSFTSTRTEP